jgi:hypothetical protein
MTGTVPDWVRQSMRKGTADTCDYSVKEMGSPFHGSQQPVRLADGGDASEAAMKQRGMEASSGEKVGLFERLKAGNIDDPNSEASKRWGAGRGRMEAELDRASKEADDLRASSFAKKAKDDADFAEVDNSFKNTRTVSGIDGPSFSEKTVARNAPGASGERAAPAPQRRPQPKISMVDTGDETSRLSSRFPAAASPKATPAPAATAPKRTGRGAYNPQASAQRAAEKAAWDKLSPAEKSASRGRAIKDFFGIGKDKQ